jgi:Xaa-Pro dipeptidase
MPMRHGIYLDFPLDEYRVRLERLRQCMAEVRLDALLLTSRDNVEYLTGFTTVSWRVPDKRFWLVLPLEGDAALTVDPMHMSNAEATTWVDDIRVWGADGRSAVDHVIDIILDRRLERATLGMELATALQLHMSHRELAEIMRRLSNVTYVDGSHTVARARMIKSPMEIKRIVRACEITCIGVQAGFDTVRVGMTEHELLNIVVGAWLKCGADTAYTSTNHGYLAIQASRVRQMTPSPVERKIEAGDLIQLDGGACYRGYSADIYRNAMVGVAPPARLQEYAEGCRHIQENTVAAIKPGMTSSEIVAVAERLMRETGLQKRRRVLMDAISAEKGSMIGHGIGFTLHELPFIVPGDDTIWTEGMCGALEIAFGDEEVGYIEWEDNFLVTRDGCQVLTPLERRLRVVGA